MEERDNFHATNPDIAVETRKPAAKPKTPNAGPETGHPEKTSAKTSSTAHPAGERAQKRQSALAENLKNWLAKRKPDTE